MGDVEADGRSLWSPENTRNGRRIQQVVPPTALTTGICLFYGPGLARRWTRMPAACVAWAPITHVLRSRDHITPTASCSLISYIGARCVRRRADVLDNVEIANGNFRNLRDFMWAFTEGGTICNHHIAAACHVQLSPTYSAPNGCTENAH